MDSAGAGGIQIPRFRSIDQIRGAVMILMALDHVRWFFTNLNFQPEELARTDLVLFLTRWVTHYCAPGFFLLAGMGIFIYATKIHDPVKLARYLLSRGAMLVALELTIVGFSWVFTPGYSFAGVIWALGWSFMAMAALARLPRAALLVLSIAVLTFHNLLDGASVEGPGLVLWRALYQSGPAGGYFFLFPVIPWLAMMVLGYAVGDFFLKPVDERKRLFLMLGAGCIIAFALLRVTNLYGNPDVLWISRTTSGLFALQPEIAKTIVNFLNTEKYPPSLQFALMTLGPIFLWLGLSRVDDKDARPGPFARVLILFGRVPLFYYVLHLYLIHLLALAMASLAGQPVTWITFGADPRASRDAGFGFDLWVIHVMWLVAVAMLYPACRWYQDYKRTHDYVWLKYL